MGSTTITVAGPFDETAARETAKFLGASNHSVFSRYKVDADGFCTTEKEWFVERDTAAQPQMILGYSWAEIQNKQRRG